MTDYSLRISSEDIPKKGNYDKQIEHFKFIIKTLKYLHRAKMLNTEGLFTIRLLISLLERYIACFHYWRRILEK